MRPMRLSAVVLVASLLAACAGASPTARPSERLFPPGSHFNSALYGFSIDLPDGWRPDPATERWNGTFGTFGSDAASSDRFHFQGGYTAWVAAAPTGAGLDHWIAGQDASDARRHECPAHPTAEEFQIAGGEARIESKHCPTDSPTVIVMAATIHAGVGYFFYFIHPADIEASDTDQRVFEAMLSTVTFSS
jgi:hypothetical protein